MRSTERMQPRAKKPGPNNSNVFALAASQTRRQDRSYYKSLYNFNADVELAEYSLPVLSSQTGAGGKPTSGQINQTKLAPIEDQPSMEGQPQYDMDGNLVGGMDPAMMEEEMDPYGDEEDEDQKVEQKGGEDFDLNYDQFQTLIESHENVENNHMSELGKAQFIKKGTEIWHMQQAIKTGTQAIAFFAKNGINMPIKFLNCNRKQVRPGEFRPYDLEVIEDEKCLNDEFFTISNRGVVQIVQDKSQRMGRPSKKPIPTEFLSLSEWMHQSTMFNVLTSMKFFKYYLIGKVFSLWKGNVRYRTYHRTRQELSKNLIQQRRDFLSCHMEINKILYDMQSKLTFTPYRSAGVIPLDTFNGVQVQHRAGCRSTYNDKVDAIVTQQLSGLVKRVTEEQNLREEEDLENSQRGQAAKNKSMSSQTKEDELRRRLGMLTRRNVRALGTYIRLVDYMVLETQVRINQESATKILNEMQNSAKKYWIQTAIRFDMDEEQMSFQPPRIEFIQSFEKLLKDMLSTAEDVNRVTTQPDFQHHIHGLMTDTAPRFRAIVDSSQAYASMRQNIIDCLEKDFREIEKVAKRAESCRDIYHFSITFNFEEYKATNPDMEAIRVEFLKYLTWDIRMNKQIQSQFMSGILQLAGRKLRDNLSEKVQSEMDNLRLYLYDLAIGQVEKIRKGIKKIHENLGKSVYNLESFVTFVQAVKDAQVQRLELADMRKQVEEQKNTLVRNKQKGGDAQRPTGTIGPSAIIQLQQKLEEVTVALTTTGSPLDNDITNAIEKRQNEKDKFEDELLKHFDKEKLRITELQELIKSPSLMNANTDSEAALSELSKIEKKYKMALEKIESFRSYETVLGIEKVFKLEELTKFQEAYDLRFDLWNNRNEFKKDRKTWFDGYFREQDSEATCAKIQKYDKLTKNIRAMKIPKGTNDDVLDKLTEEIQEVAKYKSLIAALGVSAMKSRHWAKVFDLLKEVPPASMDSMTLQQLLDMGAGNFIGAIDDISGAACGEEQIEKTLAGVVERWYENAFVVMPYRDFKDKFLITEIDDLIMKLEDDQMTVGTMMGSKFVTEVREEVEEMEQKLKYIDIVIQEWLIFQQSWMYLENIFSADDIREQLKDETKLFNQVDKFWREHMLRCNKDPIVINFVDSGTLRKKFEDNNKRLDEIKQKLEDYLTTKRAAFPRFFFLTNDELIQILSQTRNAQAVQPFLNKCFDSIKRIKFTEEKNSKEILAMTSPEGEVVDFYESCFAHGPVENWLNNIEQAMFVSLYMITRNAMEIYPEDGRHRDEWLFHCAAQCILVVDQVKWTNGVEGAIFEIMGGKNRSALQEFNAFSQEQLTSMINLVGGALGKQERNMMGALIVLDVHGRTVVDRLIKTRVDNINDFDWQCQLRYYWEELVDSDGEPLTGAQTHEAFVKQTNTRFRYGYEYQGNGPRLVVTPLTDKCYMTLTGALHLNYGGNPQGPAGTGKTETTKDLGKALAICTIVFNCSDELTYKMMERYFMGLASQGAWSCFDEFNRIGIEVLSVIAQQMLTIQTAVRGRAPEFEFCGRVIPLNMKFGVFITMNPGYAGRQELPDNLKALFRPVSMMIPNYALIAEITLYSEGFMQAKSLSEKMARLYSLSSEQLSKQKHYDFGMRAVKTVLVMAGKIKRQDRDTPEEVILIRAMRDSNVPKFLTHDLPLFYGIIQDLFPTTVVPFIDYGKLQLAVENELRKEKKQIVPDFVKKIIQLLETMIIRHGNMIVGSTGTGKTTVSRILMKALTTNHAEGVIDCNSAWYKPVKLQTLNPKSVTKGELYGESNPYTNEWQEGIVSSLVKSAVDDADNEKLCENKRWVNFDGPVDAMWIENMNTVLDDNKMLCLPNGERIKMPDTCTMMFEVNDLVEASPATVSRCGMVYLEPVYLGWEPLVHSWIEEMDGIIAKKFLPFIRASLIQGIRELLPKIRRNCKEMIASQDCNIVQSCLSYIFIFLNMETIPLENKDRIFCPEKPIMNYIAFALIWAFGGNLHDDSRMKFQKYFREAMDTIECEYKAELPDGDLFEYTIDTEYYKFQHWDELKTDFKYDRNLSYFNILVPTSDTVKYNFMIGKLTDGECNVLMSGETGVGKSVVTRDYLMNAPENIDSAFVNFSGKTTTKNLVDALEGKLESRRRDVLGAKPGKKMIFFVDDVNMPQLDAGKAQPPCELLRQVLDQGGFYDTKKLFFKKVQDTKFVTACAPPGGGRNEVSPRLFRQFTMLWVPSLSTQSMRLIFTSILRGYFDLKEDPGLSLQAEDIVKSAVDIYEQSITTFLPTPSKCHYTFNLRDLSKVVQGMLMCPFDDIENKDYCTKLFACEIFRVFRDRLVDEDDRRKFSEMSHRILENHLSMDWSLEDFETVIFGDYDNQRRNYVLLNATQDLIPRLEELLMLFNAENSPMNLVFFEDCVQHLTRVARTLRQERGNMLLVGYGGSGRRSMARLGASINEITTFTIEITKSYREKEFHDDIKSMLMKCGLAEEKVQFLFSDTQIVLESFLEDINNLLNSGEIPNLFPADEKTTVCEEIETRAREAGQGNGRDQQFAFFIAECRQRLHIVLAFSPVGEKFRERCRQFPSIINCCTMDWYNLWPREALYSVASRSYEENKTDLGLVEEVSALAEITVYIHNSVTEYSEKFYEELRRRNYTTPTSYLELVKTFVEMLKHQKEVVPGKMFRYEAGLKKLAETNTMVAQLQKDLVVLRPEISEKEKKVQVMVEELKRETAIASEQEKITAKDEADARKIKAEVVKIQGDCKAILDEAMPQYNKAISALDTLKAGDISEVKMYMKPKEEIVLVFQAVCLLQGVKQDWSTAQGLMNNPSNFVQGLKTFDKDNIKEGTLKKLKKFINDERFTPDNIARFSLAAKSVCMWVKAMDTYCEVLKVVTPLRSQLKEAEGRRADADKQLQTKQAELQVVRDKIAQYERAFRENQLILESLVKQKEMIEIKLIRADKLTSGLASESERWKDAVAKLEADMVNLMGNMMLAAGYQSYVGVFTSSFRNELLELWKSSCRKKKIKFDRTFSIESVLGDPVRIRDWKIKGLPADQLSVENGIICMSAKRWPLLIDPQGQGNKWIKNMEKENNLQVTKLSNPKFLKIIEVCLPAGNPVLIENIDESLDPSLEPLLTKDVRKVNGQDSIKLGDTWVAISTDFKFFVTTKWSNPHYLPEVCIKVTLINFTVTPGGLEDQLLVDVIKYEQPELEQQRDQLIVQLADFKRQLQEIEDKILKLVSEASEDILADEELINVLEQSKVTSTAINERVAEAEKTAVVITEQRESYRVVACRGSILYFVIADLASIDPMYQYSLEFFSKLFNTRLEKSEQAEEKEARIEAILTDITEAFYINICRGLFERDKLMYSFLNTTSIMRNAGFIDPLEWNFFLRGSPNDHSDQENKCDFISTKQWQALYALELEVHPNYKDITKSFEDPCKFLSNIQSIFVIADRKIWKTIMETENPQKIAMPPIYEDRLTSFQKFILMKSLRESKLLLQCKVFVKQELGKKFIESPPFDLAGSHSDSLPSTPIIFVLTPGSDPMANLTALAKAKGMGDRFKSISLGQGQGPEAAAMMDEGQRSGNWVCLQNCHLYTSWMPELEKIQERQDESMMNQDYRLWLTTFSSPSFPVPVLQSGIKLTNEPPKGLKANMARTFADIGEEGYELCEQKPREYKKLVFALAYFHAAILERRKYGAIGWNERYEWMTSDFDCSNAQLRMFVAEQPEVPYQALNYIVSEVNYGGRVTDDRDIRTINSMLRKYFCPEIMSDNYRLSKLDIYYAPPEGNLASVLEYLEQLPLDEDPEVFGLHPNCNMTYEAGVVAAFLNSVTVIQPRVASAGTGKSPEEEAREMAQGFSKVLPINIDLSNKHPGVFANDENGKPLSLGVFCEQEIVRFNILLNIMRKSLIMLDRAIEGTVVMSMELEQMFNNFLDGKVPSMWITWAYPSLKPLNSWFDDLIDRIHFMRGWCHDGPRKSYWIPALFFPQGFKTAALQMHARKNLLEIDKLTFKTNILAVVEESLVDDLPETGVNIHGNFIEGAKWDFKRKQIDDMEHKVAISPFPVVWLEPVFESEMKADRMYECPLYKTSQRRGELTTTGHSTNFIMYLLLPSEVNPEHWVRRGSAMLCMTDD